VNSLSTHQSLLARLARGDDQAAWADCFARYRDLILGVARRRGCVGADGEDVLQDVFLQLGKAMPRFRYDQERGRFRGFLKTIAVRAIGKRLRRHGLEARHGERTGDGSPAQDGTPDPELEAAWESEWRQYHLRQAMMVLRSEVRATDLRAFEAITQGQRDARQVALELGISVDSVYQIKSRVLRRLRELIATQVADEG
jgi:RNA polymerase sigma-70 factor, ECF subfamily